MRLTIYIIIVFTLAASIIADSDSRAAVFLTMPVGWKQISMGGCGVALGAEANSGWYNPAALRTLDNWGGTAGYSKLALDRWIYHVSGGWNIKNDAAVALSWVHADAGEIPGRSISGNYTGNLEYGDDAISLTFSKRITSEFSLGGNVKYVQSRLSDITTYVAGFDVGAHGRFFQNKLFAGLTYRNIGMKYQWQSAEIYGTDHGAGSDEEIPGTFAAGAGYKPGFLDVEVTAEIGYGNYGTAFRVGASVMPLDEISLSAGVDNGLFTAGASYGRDAGFAIIGVGYALRLEREGLPPRHTFDLIVSGK